MGKSLEQFFHPDEDEYRKQISSLDEHKLTALHQITKQKIIGAYAATGTSLTTTLFAGPAGLVGAAVSGRRVNVNKRRLAIIQERLEREGWAGYEMRKRDYLKPIVITGTVALVAPGAGAVVGHFARHAATHAATNIHLAVHHGATAAGGIARHPETFAKAVEHEVIGQGYELTHQTVRHAADAGMLERRGGLYACTPLHVADHPMITLSDRLT